MILLEFKITGLSEVLSGLESDIDNFQSRLAEQIPVEARRIIDEGKPSGRLYRRKAITKRKTKGLLQLGLKQRGKTQVVAGSQFHRASRKGEPWANDSGRAYREISVRKTAKGHYQVRFGAPYTGILEFTLDRPVAIPAIEAAVRKIIDV
jgi:hypothetical protein